MQILNDIKTISVILDKIDFRAKKIIGDGEGHYITVKASIHQKDIF